jgi:hypothetical protein
MVLPKLGVAGGLLELTVRLVRQELHLPYKQIIS